MKDLSKEIRIAILACAPYLDEINSSMVTKMVNMIISILVRKELLTPEQGIINRLPYDNKNVILDEPWGDFWDTIQHDEGTSKKIILDWSAPYDISQTDYSDLSGVFEKYIDFTSAFPITSVNREEEE